MFRSGINMQLLEHGAAQRVTRQHAFDCTLDHTLRVLLKLVSKLETKVRDRDIGRAVSEVHEPEMVVYPAHDFGSGAEIDRQRQRP